MNARPAILAALIFGLGWATLAATQVTIGAGDETHNLPIYVNFHNSLCEIIYYPDEIGSMGTITALSFYADFYTEVPLQGLKVWLGTTDWPNMSAGWIPSTELTLAFNGTVYYPEGESQVTLGLDTPFDYTGGNLVLLIQHPWEMDDFHNNNYFRCQYGTPLRTRNVVSEDDVLDPALPPAPLGGQLTSLFPQTTLHFAAQPPQPEIFIQPESCAFGEVLVNGLDNLQISLFNTGLSPLELSEISLSGSPYFSLLQLPALPATLPSGGSVSFIAHYEPLQPGPHSATISITANTDPTLITVPVTGTGIDPTIYSLPYSQDFDLCEPPDLPIDWSAYLEPVANLPFVRTFADAEAPTQPNLVRIMADGDGIGRAILIAPPLDTSIPVSSTQISFSAQAYGTVMESAISVGVMSDPEDPFTYTQVQYIDIDTSTWTDYTVQFFGYQGAGRHIAFDLPQLGGYNWVKLDNISISYLAGNDLAATSVSGTTFPCVDAASEYLVSVANQGNGTQSGYLVKLLNDAGAVLGSVVGPTLAHSETAQVAIPWTPFNAGIHYLRGEVILAGDSAPANNASPLYQVNVLAAGTTTVTIGNGSQLARIPADFYRRNSLFETVFQAAELHQTGTLTGVQFYSNFFTSTPLTKPLRVWLGETAANDLSAGWISSNDLQLVFEGSVDLRPGSDIVPVLFTAPFAYQGGNLVLLVQRPWDGQFYSSSDFFLCQSLGEFRSRNYASDTIELHPEAPPLPTLAQLSGQFPRATFFIQGGSPVAEDLHGATLALRIGPNPFRERCQISFSLSGASHVDMQVFNLRGQMVRTLVQGSKSAGEFSYLWDGKDAAGRAVSSGIYLCRLRIGDRQTVQKLLRID